MSWGCFPYLSKQSLNRYATTSPEGSSSENAASGLATNLTLSYWNLSLMCLIISVSPSHSLSYLLQPLHSSIHGHLHIKSLYPFTHHPHLSDYLTSTILTGSQKWQHDGNIKPKNYTQISWHLLPCSHRTIYCSYSWLYVCIGRGGFWGGVWGFTLKPFSFRNC